MEESEEQNLKNENEQLKQKLCEYKQLEEDLLAEKVYKKAKAKLVQWYSIGGIALFIGGVWGIKEVVTYMESRADDALKQVTKVEVIKIVEQSVEKKISVLMQGQEDTLSLLVRQKIAEINSVNSKIKGAQNGDTSLTESILSSDVHFVDLSTEMNPIRDNGNEGSVVGFAIASALEYQIFQHDKKRVSISPRYIYNCINNGIDGGANIEDGLKLVETKGAIEDKYWPYKAGKFKEAPPISANNAFHYKISNYQKKKPTVNEIKNSLIKKLPVIIILTIYDSFYNPEAANKGIVSAPSKTDQVEGGLAVCIVGFDDDKKRFKFRNSWTTEWGDKGYFYISYSDMTKFNYEVYTLTYP